MSEPTAAVGTQPSTAKNVTALDLHMMPQDELIALYHELEALPFEEMHEPSCTRSR